MLYFGKIEWLHKGWNHFDHPEYQQQTEDTLCHLTRSRAAASMLHLQSRLRGQAETFLILAPSILAFIFAPLLTHSCHHSAPILLISIRLQGVEKKKKRTIIFLYISVRINATILLLYKQRERSFCLFCILNISWILSYKEKGFEYKILCFRRFIIS